MNKLKKYNDKRDFEKTDEPIGKTSKSNGKRLKFVIQYHEARKNHYDLRLEWKGVYLSWAVPKGPSFNPKDKRLAIRVEDHPISYGKFEGNIPKGEYGAGSVMLWDKGYWKNDYEKFDIDEGPFKFELDGERLKGKWNLVKIKDDNWLLIKEKDSFSKGSNGISRFKTSIISGRTSEEIENNVVKDNIDIEVTNPDKYIFDGIKKIDVFNYYKLVADKIMHFLDNRLISAVTAPSGMNGEKFYMKHFNSDNKDLGKKVLKNKDGENEDYFYIKNTSGLLYEVQMNSYEFHIWGSKQNSVNKPDLLVFDLDPDEGIPLKRLRDGVRDLKNILDKFELKSFLKTSGGKGYHIVVPLKTSSWQKTEKIARDITKLMVNSWPDKYTDNMRMESRKNKIFIDYLRNKKGATSVAPYSLRLKDKASISFPISWSELNKVKPDSITIRNIKNKLKRKDPWMDLYKELLD